MSMNENFTKTNEEIEAEIKKNNPNIEFMSKERFQRALENSNKKLDSTLKALSPSLNK